MNHALMKAVVRRTVHAQFAVPVSVTPKGATVPLDKSLTARLHNKVTTDPDNTSRGGATFLADTTRVIFSREELTAQGVTLGNGDRVYFPDYLTTVTLNVKDPYNGPVTEKWTVQQTRTK